MVGDGDPLIRFRVKYRDDIEAPPRTIHCCGRVHHHHIEAEASYCCITDELGRCGDGQNDLGSYVGRFDHYCGPFAPSLDVDIAGKENLPSPSYVSFDQPDDLLGRDMRYVAISNNFHNSSWEHLHPANW